MVRLARGLFLLTLLLLPLQQPPAWPTLHHGVQWSDLTLAAACACWLPGRLQRPWRWSALHAAFAVYLASASVAWWLAPDRDAFGLAKLLGIVSLIAFALIAADLLRAADTARGAGRMLALASVLSAAAAVTGLALFLAGQTTPLVGGYGDLQPGSYARARAGFTHPNLLGSFGIAAVGLVSSRRAGLPPRSLRVVRVALGVAVVLAFSRSLFGFAVAIAIAAADRPRRRALAGLVVAATVAAVAALTLGHLTLDPTRPWEARWLETPSPRLQMLVSSWQTFRAHPLGVGPGALAGERDGLPYEAHCTPLNVAATLGAPAALALLAVPWLLWRRRTHPLDRAAWGALAGLGVDALANDVEDFRHLWLLFGWLAADADESPPPDAAG